VQIQGLHCQYLGIETDNWSWNPSGTLAHANATATVTAGSLTTSLADTTVTFAWAFTLTRGVKYHVVLFQGTYGAELVNGTTHYKIGIYAISTTTRNSKFWSGSAWFGASLSNETTGDTFVAAGTGAISYGYRVTALTSCYVYSIRKTPSSWATRARIYSVAGSALATASFVGNIATFSSPYQLTAGTDYRLECDNSWASYNFWNDSTPLFPSRTNLSFTVGSFNGNTNTGPWYNIESVDTWLFLNPYNFAYVDSSLFDLIALSKTNSDYSYKIDFHGFSGETVASGVIPKVIIWGTSPDQSWLTYDADQYLSSTPWGISWTAGTNVKKIGKAKSATQVEINKFWKWLWTSISGASSGTASDDMIVTAYWNGTSWQTIIGTSNWNVLQSVVGTTAWGTTTHSICFPVKKWATWSVTGTMTISTSNIWQTTLA